MDALTGTNRQLWIVLELYHCLLISLVVQWSSVYLRFDVG
jgi:hypothetical protein